ncbi:peptidase [Streptomyces sp. CC208A]|uniref:peptidase n=1 Tax=Streptomyces sp. CC208A TaxID=3044573 RepID=UPI0024A7C2AE|nr:peptidase [Streptomyces sp. CC208A]
MKIRRILATAVAAAVTTPVVFLSAGPAFADTKPTASTTAPTTTPSYKELEEAVAAAQAKVDELKEQRAAVEAKIDRFDKDPSEFVDADLLAAQAAAKEALDTALAAHKAAEADLAAAKKALEDAAQEEKEAAETAVAEAQKALDEAAAALKTAQTEARAANDPVTNVLVAMFQELHAVDLKLKPAEEELAKAKEALANFEEPKPEPEEEEGNEEEEGEEEEGAECVEDDAVHSTLTGPKTITIGSSANFSLTVKNTSDRDLDSVRSYLFAAHLPESWEDVLLDDETDFAQYFSIDWKSAANPKWTGLDFEEDAIELGRIAKGDKVDVTLRLTVDGNAPEGKGITFSSGEYDNEDGSCGISGQYAEATFDVVEAKDGEPTATPSPSASTPAPAATSNNTTAQGGSSNTPVNGTLAATGAGDGLTRIGMAAGAAVALGAGAMFVARRRKAGADA